MFKSLTIMTLVLAPATAPALAHAQPAPAQPLPYWHVWADAAGQTHQVRCEFKGFTPLSLGPGVAPVFGEALKDVPARVVIAQFPKGWVGEWHPNPKPQWVVPLSGRWFVETTDGHRVEMGPGEASFGEDQAAMPDRAGHAGHLSGTLGDAPITLMFVQLEGVSRQDDPCRVK